ncbi:SAFB-like transcription modulator [Bactrocera neohumeralis]|uniref:SAFB-like transcription modulator n=1 Tax=Bactrocera neohumeralis TaxID=98809 RepID=UPI0021664717|nr:SAFB-like transcription modulator [Bactrocera neohumeralis]
MHNFHTNYFSKIFPEVENLYFEITAEYFQNLKLCTARLQKGEPEISYISLQRDVLFEDFAIEEEPEILYRFDSDLKCTKVPIFYLPCIYLSSAEEETAEVIEEDKNISEVEVEEESLEELHKASKTEEKPTKLVTCHLSLPAGSHFGKMWTSEVQVKSFEDETEVADHILEDDAKTQNENFTTSLKYIKEKCTDTEGDNTGRNSAQKRTKTVAALKDTRTSKGGSSSSKDERQCSKPDDDKSKRKDEKSGDKKDKDISEQKSSSNKTSQKDDKVNTSTKLSSTGKQTTPSRNLLVSGLSSLTRASDLKTIFSKYGKVIGAKVVTNSRTPGTSCYGYATMSSSSDASRSVAKIRVDTTKKYEDKKIRDTTSKTRDDKQTIDTKKYDVSKKPEVEKDKQRDKEKEKDYNKKDVNKTIEIAIIDPVGKADVVTTIWELLIPWQR